MKRAISVALKVPGPATSSKEPPAAILVEVEIPPADIL
jgi:hypothetical protein